MSRANRYDFAGQIYLALNRGNAGRNINCDWPSGPQDCAATTAKKARLGNHSSKPQQRNLNRQLGT